MGFLLAMKQKKLLFIIVFFEVALFIILAGFYGISKVSLFLGIFMEIFIFPFLVYALSPLSSQENNLAFVYLLTVMKLPPLIILLPMFALSIAKIVFYVLVISSFISVFREDVVLLAIFCSVFTYSLIIYFSTFCVVTRIIGLVIYSVSALILQGLVLFSKDRSSLLIVFLL